MNPLYKQNSQLELRSGSMPRLCRTYEAGLWVLFTYVAEIVLIIMTTNLYALYNIAFLCMLSLVQLRVANLFYRQRRLKRFLEGRKALSLCIILICVYFLILLFIGSGHKEKQASTLNKNESKINAKYIIPIRL